MGKNERRRRQVNRPPPGQMVTATRGPDGKWRLPDGTEVQEQDVTANPVPLADRQGVFAHWLKCPACKVEFLLMSWRRNRPAEVPLGCPECQSGVALLGTVTLNERPDFGLAMHPSGEGAVEIYNLPGLIGEKLSEAP